ncbi:MAG: phosphate ABC transporter permease PstA [Opitutales bacterium]|jgi:phosphate transport system permease protein|nr:MAG: phosphate ABC transporter permease PstA [Opitutales bacterium]
MATNSDSSTPRGESWVWFTGLGLIIGLAMVIGLLSLVVVNGITVFWAPPVPVVKLDDGKGIIGQLAQRRIRPGTPANAPRYERQYQVGLRELNGNSYLWVDEAKIKAEEFPTDVLGLERVENGPAFVRPITIKKSDGKVLAMADAEFEVSLQAEVAAAHLIRERLVEINRHQVGEVNADMESARIALRRAVDLHQEAEAVKYREFIAKLEARYAVLQAEGRKVSEGGAVATLVVQDAAGRSVTVPLTQVMRAWFPNRLDTWGRVQLFFSRLGEFVFDEPREANTEGGLMPAIFGTLVMTVFMSLMVTPFGVVTAIYLREYAQQGPVLRIVRISVNNLAGVPSIVFGVFGLGFFVYVLGGTIDQLFFADQLKYNNNSPVFGTGGMLWCSLTLALMTLPVVIVATEEALASVPRGMREASLATGASKWQTIRDILLPASAPGILTGVILAMARGAGEVAPLMLVGVVKLAPTLPLDGTAPFLHLDRKFMHLGFHVYDLGFQSPDSDAARPMVFATTLLLIVLVVCLNIGAIWIRNRLRARFKGASF